MKAVLVIVLVVLLLVLALPLAMGMDMESGSCPACTSAERPWTLGMCLAVLAFVVLMVRFSSSRFFLCAARFHDPPPPTSPFRPPRIV